MAAFTVASTRPATLAARAPVARASLRARVAARPFRATRFVVRAEPSPIETAIEEAKEACEGDNQGECAAAWDEVEELSAAAAHKKASQKSSDPLEEFCDDNPDADECRVYED
mmetsp:Transcript_22534/g.62520  ORF Transcript_22534/g.62520 Transcript_22534/m.62520 type:complete len:113 (-) Transcript_22534:278-616(-)|eukprot:CAMPEP_0117662946 /NCGR_PEP_ID=MMETSP0804-20121206/8322_1 /TAXON_ID=1074897 /ORGANISM="Tetraselmis astigmatica, Strain CCMP880" /LENGTH=112 /DNA_ID=CAMNT_0005469875 /DNA_START=123 /DNA_END=461 /DNA_ORIENTATION=-